MSGIPLVVTELAVGELMVDSRSTVVASVLRGGQKPEVEEMVARMHSAAIAMLSPGMETVLMLTSSYSIKRYYGSPRGNLSRSTSKFCNEYEEMCHLF